MSYQRSHYRGLIARLTRDLLQIDLFIIHSLESLSVWRLRSCIAIR